VRPGPFVLALVLAALLAAPATAATWGQRTNAAAAYVQTRAGTESFALVDDQGHIHGYRLRARAPSASLLKAMALVAYLNLGSVRDRPLNDHDRALLGPMIRRSDNAAASAVLRTVGSHAMYRVAERADMWDFSFAWPIWGNSTTTARDQARFFIKIDRLVPSRHRGYALAVLSEIVPSQRWGIPPVHPPSWSIHFKGGWGSGTGAVAHQSALLRKDGMRIALSVLTLGNPSHGYGTDTIRGVAARLLARPLPLAPR
jgi:beta-lactamase family protein